MGNELHPWVPNPHITGVAVSISGICGRPSEVHQADCVVRGRSFASIQEEISLGYLENPTVEGESYRKRMAWRHAFQAEMKAGSFILIPRGVSQTAACDRNYYQVILFSGNSMPPPGTLPLFII